MNNPWPLRPLGSFLTESREAGSTGETAKKLTVRLYGRGAVANDGSRPGSPNTKYFRRRAGQLVYSRLDFLNGAFAIVPAHLDGLESTQDLPAFDIAPEVHGDWLVRVLSQPSFYKRFALAAKGSRKARRVNPEEFLESSLAVPPISEQRNIAAILASID